MAVLPTAWLASSGESDGVRVLLRTLADAGTSPMYEDFRVKITKVQDETIIELTWFDRIVFRIRHYVLGCDGWCSYCITEAEKDGERWL